MKNPIHFPCVGDNENALLTAIEFAERRLSRCDGLQLDCHKDPTVSCLLLEDALRYLASQRGIPFAVARP